MRRPGMVNCRRLVRPLDAYAAAAEMRGLGLDKLSAIPSTGVGT